MSVLSLQHMQFSFPAFILLTTDIPWPRPNVPAEGEAGMSEEEETVSDLQLQDRITEDHFMSGLRDMGQEINALVALAVNALTRQSQTREMGASLDEALGGEQALQEASERLRRTLPGV